MVGFFYHEGSFEGDGISSIGSPTIYDSQSNVKHDCCPPTTAYDINRYLIACTNDGCLTKDVADLYRTLYVIDEKFVQMLHRAIAVSWEDVESNELKFNQQCFNALEDYISKNKSN